MPLSWKQNPNNWIHIRYIIIYYGVNVCFNWVLHFKYISLMKLMKNSLAKNYIYIHYTATNEPFHNINLGQLTLGIDETLDNILKRSWYLNKSVNLNMCLVAKTIILWCVQIWLMVFRIIFLELYSLVTDECHNNNNNNNIITIILSAVN